MAIAEAIGAVLDPAGGGAAGLAYQALGSSTATFGEIRDRAELVVAWRADPVDDASAAAGPPAPGVATALVVVDDRRTATAEQADAFIELDAALDFEALWALRALVAGAPLDRDRAGELPLAGLDELAERLLAARHVALLYGAGSDEVERAGAVRARARPQPRPARGRAGAARARATRAAPRTSSPGRPASPRR